MSLNSGRDWVAFFGDAGIPSAAAKTYAASFVENRIRGDMLADLDKEYLRDMGITVLGDIICILKHAKKVVDTRKKEISLKDNTTGPSGGAPPRKSTDSVASVSGADVARYKGKGRGHDNRGDAKSTTAPNEHAGRVSKSRVTEPPVAPQSSSKLTNRLGPPKEISFSDLVPVKRSSAADLLDLTPPREGTEFDESSASRRVHLAATAMKHPDDGGQRSGGSDEHRQKSNSSQSAFERLDKTGVSSDSGHRNVTTKALSSSDVRKRLGDSSPAGQSTVANRRERYDSDSDGIEDRNTRSETAPRSSTSARGIGEKNKVYWAVRTLSDGTKIRHKISPDDPLLKRVPITKLRKSVSASSSKLSAAEEAIAASSFSRGGHARMSPPRQWPRVAEAPRSVKPSSHSRSTSNRYREAIPASANAHVTRMGHAKITSPREELSGRKRPATEAMGDRKSPSPIPVVRKRISAPPATEARRYPVSSSSSVGVAEAASLSRWERERERRDRESRSSGTYIGGADDHRDDARSGRRHAVVSRLGPYKRISY